METEQIMINKALTGDMDSYSNLVLKYKNRIFAFLLKMTLSKEDAEELLQEVFISVYKNLYRYDNSWSFSTWIYKIATNKFYNFSKKKKRNNIFINIHDLENLSCCLEDHPEVIYEKKENYYKVVELIYKLKPDQKVALVLKHVKGFSYREISKILNISPEVAQMKVQRAKNTICRQYNKLYGRSL